MLIHQIIFKEYRYNIMTKNLLFFLIYIETYMHEHKLNLSDINVSMWYYMTLKTSQMSIKPIRTSEY